MIHRPRGREKKPVLCISNGQAYPSIYEAAAALGLSHSSITRALIRDIPVKGLEFKEHQKN